MPTPAKAGATKETKVAQAEARLQPVLLLIFSQLQSPQSLIDPGGRRKLRRLPGALFARERPQRPPWILFLSELATARRCLHGRRSGPIHTPAPWRPANFPRDLFRGMRRLAPRTNFPQRPPPERR